MKKKIVLLSGMSLLFVPLLAGAQTAPASLSGMQGELDKVYQQMLPMCSDLIGAGRAIAGFAALWYIASRVWRHIAAAESVDVYPLLRPFALGLAILLFPSVIAIMNGIMQPVVSATAGMVSGSNKAIETLLRQKEIAIRRSPAWQAYVGETGSGNQEKWYKYTHPESASSEDGMFDGITNSIKFWMDKQSYNFRNSIKQWMSQVLELVFQASSLCINTLRIFFLIILAIVGPLVFGFAVFDGFQHSLNNWIARYINVFLWLPIANIFGSIIGKIQENMLKIDISQIQEQGDTFFSTTDTAYMIFMLIGIVGYFSVPTIASYVVHAAGGNGLLRNVNTQLMSNASQVYSQSIKGDSVMVSSLKGFSSNSYNYLRSRLSGNSETTTQRDTLSGNK